MLTSEAAHAGAFGAHDDADAAFEIDVVEALRGFIRCADEPDAEFFKLIHGAGEIGDANERDVLRAAAGHADDGFADGGRFVLGHDHGTDASGIGGAQAGTEIVRVLDTIEDQHEWAFLAFKKGGNVALLIDAHFVVGARVAVLAGDGLLGDHVGGRMREVMDVARAGLMVV